MLSQFSYPIICSEQFSKTVAFYEDHFDYVPEFEMQGFSILKRSDRDDVYLAVISSQHDALPAAYKHPVQGMLLSYPVDDVDEFYDHVYHEGLTLMSEPRSLACGRKHFYIEDPNGILIDVAENIDISAIIANSGKDDYIMMQQA